MMVLSLKQTLNKPEASYTHSAIMYEQSISSGHPYSILLFACSALLWCQPGIVPRGLAILCSSFCKQHVSCLPGLGVHQAQAEGLWEEMRQVSLPRWPGCQPRFTARHLQNRGMCRTNLHANIWKLPQPLAAWWFAVTLSRDRATAILRAQRLTDNIHCVLSRLSPSADVHPSLTWLRAV